MLQSPDGERSASCLRSALGFKTGALLTDARRVWDPLLASLGALTQLASLNLAGNQLGRVRAA